MAGEIGTTVGEGRSPYALRRCGSRAKVLGQIYGVDGACWASLVGWGLYEVYEHATSEEPAQPFAVPQRGANYTATAFGELGQGVNRPAFSLDGLPSPSR